MEILNIHPRQTSHLPECLDQKNRYGRPILCAALDCGCSAPLIEHMIDPSADLMIRDEQEKTFAYWARKKLSGLCSRTTDRMLGQT